MVYKCKATISNTSGDELSAKMLTGATTFSFPKRLLPSAQVGQEVILTLSSSGETKVLGAVVSDTGVKGVVNKVLSALNLK